MIRCVLLLLCSLLHYKSFSWGFFGHKKINEIAVYLLPPEMLVFYKQHIPFLVEHAVDPDKRRYAVPDEAPRHFIDIDHYGAYPYNSLPRRWSDAKEKFSEDTLQRYGIVPWWVQVMLSRLTNAFIGKDQNAILKLSAEIGHYISDAHVPLHACSNHNGQYSNQKGIHGFWESRVPELLAETSWDFFIGKARYINDPLKFIWERVLESAAAADTVLKVERDLSASFPADAKYSFEERNGVILRQYSSAYTKAYDAKLSGMVERRMRQSINTVACFWLTAWINAGQPDLNKLTNTSFSAEDMKEFEKLNNAWRNVPPSVREH